MIHRSKLVTICSTAVLALALHQNAMAADEAAPAAAPAPAAAAPSTEPVADREARYEALRKSAAEVGLELPETPPWAQQPGAMPFPPSMPDEMSMPEPMSQEEWEAMRMERWEAMRERAAENGVELPETPPWKAREERRKAMQERMEQYRETIEQLTDEQKEAVMAVFGGPRGVGRTPMRHPGCYKNMRGPGYGPGFGPTWGPMPDQPEAPADSPAPAAEAE